MKVKIIVDNHHQRVEDDVTAFLKTIPNYADIQLYYVMAMDFEDDEMYYSVLIQYS